MPTNHTHEPDGPHRPRAPREVWSTATRKALDLSDTVRDHPYAAIAIAGGAGLLVGATLGSRLVRMLVGSVGMYTASELLRRYALRALDGMVEVELDADEPASE